MHKQRMKCKHQLQQLKESHSNKQSYNLMSVVTDLENYQTSEIVEKSGRTGFGSHKRLLVVQRGFLYYFSDVPKDYKTHMPNILSTIKQLPKSSIQIKHIQLIKMQSSNSPNLIIQFYSKDLINKDDIRKSIDNQNFKIKKQGGKQQQQWKFTYDKVLNCRVWYTSLLKLKSYFIKQEDKVQQFINNFNPSKRSSHVASLQKEPSNQNPNSRTSELNIISKFQQEDKKKLQKKQEKKQQKKQQKIITHKVPEPEVQLNKNYQDNHHQSHQLTPISQYEQIRNKKGTEDFRQQLEVQIRQQLQKKSQKALKTMKSQLLAKQEQIKKLQQAIRQNQKKRQMQEEMRQKQRQLQRQRQKQLQMEIEKERQKQKQLQIQREKQKKREKERERERQKQRLQKQRQKPRQRSGQKSQKRQKSKQKEQKRQKSKQKENKKKERQSERERQRQSSPERELRNRKIQSSKTQKTQREQKVNQNYIPYTIQQEAQRIDLNSFSLQTDQQEQLNQLEAFKQRYSYISGLGSTQRDTLNMFRNAGSLSFQLEQKDHSYDNYDYYTQIQLVQNSQIKFQERIKKQIKLINYINKMKEAALDAFKEYIQFNNPTKSVSFTGTLFEINIASSSGKIINIEGTQKLVYSNQQHQKLKRQFKIYSFLQDKFLQMSQKRKNFPLRVPLCFFFQFMGYSGLLKFLPYLKIIESQEELLRAERLLKKFVQEEHIINYQINYIANRVNTLYFVTVKNPYKITKQTNNIEMNPENLYGPTFIQTCRNKNIRTGDERLERQIKKLALERTRQSNKKIMSLNQILLCRSLKKLHRSTEPLSYDPVTKTRSGDFIAGFLSSPHQIRDLVSDRAQVIINGLLVSYFQHFFGLEVPSNFDIYHVNLQETVFHYEPIGRIFSYSALYPNKLLRNLPNYIESEKYELVEIAFNLLSQIDNKSDHHLEILRIKYEIKRHSNFQVTALHEMIHSLNQIRAITGKHNTVWLECFMLTIQCQLLLKQYSECLKTINQTLEYVAYMYGPQYCQGQTEDYLYLLVAETLARMGNHSDSMSVYKKLLRNPKISLSQEQISLSIAQVYANFNEVDPCTLIQFLISTISNENLSVSQAKRIASTFWQTKIKKFIGLLYLRINNSDLCVKYLEDSFKYYQQNGMCNEDEADNVLQICATLFNNYQRSVDRSSIFSKLILMVETNIRNEKISIHIIRMTKAFVTSCFCQCVKLLDKRIRKKLSTVLEQIRNDDSPLPKTVHPITLQQLEKTILKLSQISDLGLKQAKVMQLVEISQIQIFILSLD